MSYAKLVSTDQLCPPFTDFTIAPLEAAARIVAADTIEIVWYLKLVDVEIPLTPIIADKRVQEAPELVVFRTTPEFPAATPTELLVNETAYKSVLTPLLRTVQLVPLFAEVNIVPLAPTTTIATPL